ncbi:MAG: pitrilysin family protein [Patescibacteria group bacterium]|jgi:predicted Zn-dependent peptidase
MIQQAKLKNGLRMIVAPRHETEAVTALVLFKVGSRNETKDINGVSHFIEHLMFKGTKKRPTTLSISKELDGIGAEYNAFTSKDYTGYYIKANAEKLPLLLDILSDMLYNSKFDPKEIERERGVIIEEINMYRDNPLMYIDDVFEGAMYGDHPLGWDIAGPRKIIRTVSRAKLVAYKNTFYQPNNTNVIVAGRVNEKTIFDQIRFAFETNKKSKALPKPKKKTITQKKPTIALSYKETEQVQMALGYPAYPYNHKNLIALHVLAAVLGGNMSSRLFIQVRERRGLAYSVRAGVSMYEDTGNFMVQSGLAHDRVDEALKVIFQELKLIQQKGITAIELGRAKEFLKGQLVLQMEDSRNAANYYGQQALFQPSIKTPHEREREVERVTRADVLRVAKDIMKMSRLTLAIIGPYKDKAHFIKLLSR